MAFRLPTMLAVLLSTAFLLPLSALSEQVLSLSEAERLALIDDPATLRYRELAEARREAAISVRQLLTPC